MPPKQAKSPVQNVDAADYDSHFKELMTHFSFQFIKRFLPDMYPYIDLDVPIELLEQEFPSSLRPKKKGRKITDKLMKVRMRSGEDHIILTHVEVHSTGESTFSKKMYLYNSVIYLQRNTDITALAIFTTEHYPTEHNSYVRDCFGTKVVYTFNSFIISKQDEKKLLKSDDLFDLAILACLYIIRTREDMEKRLIYKKKLHNLAMEKNFSALQMEKILIFVEEMLQLPAPIELKFEKHLNFKYKKLRAMELSQNSKNMFDAMFSGMFKGKFGMSYQKMMRDNAKSQKEAERRTEEERRRTEEERRQKEEVQAKLILLLYVQSLMPIEQIAKEYDIDLEIVQKVVKKHLDSIK